MAGARLVRGISPDEPYPYVKIVAVMQPARAIRTPLALAAAVLGVLLATLAVPSAQAQQPDPQHDYYQIPQGCAGPARTAPQSPVGCRLTPWEPHRPIVVLWGDSHAWQNIPALITAAKAENVNFTAFVMGKCPPSLIRIQARYPGQCERSNALALKYVRDTARRRQPVQVILGSHWAGFAQKVAEFERTGVPPEGYDEFDMRMLKLFRDHTAKLFPALLRTRAQLAMISQTATCEKRINQAPLRCSQPRHQAILHEGKTRRSLARLSHNAPQIDLNKLFCGPAKCRGKVGDDYVFWDWGHLSKTVDYKLAPYFRPLLHDLRD
jgi:hypothetical protein